MKSGNIYLYRYFDYSYTFHIILLRTIESLREVVYCISIFVLKMAGAVLRTTRIPIPADSNGGRQCYENLKSDTNTAVCVRFNVLI